MLSIQISQRGSSEDLMIILLARAYYKNIVRLGMSEMEEEERRKLTDE